MTNPNAAFGCAQLEWLEEMVAAKRVIAAHYHAAFATRNHMTPMPHPQGCPAPSSPCPATAT